MSLTNSTEAVRRTKLIEKLPAMVEKLLAMEAYVRAQLADLPLRTGKEDPEVGHKLAAARLPWEHMHHQTKEALELLGLKVS